MTKIEHRFSPGKWQNFAGDWHIYIENAKSGEIVPVQREDTSIRYVRLGRQILPNLYREGWKARKGRVKRARKARRKSRVSNRSVSSRKLAGTKGGRDV